MCSLGCRVWSVEYTVYLLMCTPCWVCNTALLWACMRMHSLNKSGLWTRSGLFEDFAWFGFGRSAVCDCQSCRAKEGQKNFALSIQVCPCVAAMMFSSNIDGDRLDTLLPCSSPSWKHRSAGCCSGKALAYADGYNRVNYAYSLLLMLRFMASLIANISLIDW